MIVTTAYRKKISKCINKHAMKSKCELTLFSF